MLFQDVYYSSNRGNPSPVALTSWLVIFQFFKYSNNQKQTTEHTHKKSCLTPSLFSFLSNEVGHKKTMKELGFYFPIALEYSTSSVSLTVQHCNHVSQTLQPTPHFPTEELFLLVTQCPAREKFCNLVTLIRTGTALSKGTGITTGQRLLK